MAVAVAVGRLHAVGPGVPLVDGLAGAHVIHGGRGQEGQTRSESARLGVSTSSGRCGSRLICESFQSRDVGVGRCREEEDAEPPVRCARVGSAKAVPATVIPEVGQVSENTSECPQSRLTVASSHTSRAGFQRAIGCRGVGTADVLPDDELGTDDIDGLAHLHPQVGAGALGHASAFARVAQVLTGGTAGDDVDRLHGGPVDLGHVTVVGDVRPMVGEHLGRGLVELDEPCRTHVEDGREGELDTAISGEEAASGEHQAPSRPT